MSQAHQELRRRQQALKDRLQRLLYDWDPEGMGSSVAAPLDEYSDTAVLLIRVLRERQSSAPTDAIIREVLPDAQSELVDEIDTAWKDAKLY